MKPRETGIRRWFVTGFLVVLAGAAYVAGYRETEIDPGKLIRSLPKSQKILSDLLHPDVVTHKTQTATFDIVFPVPCGSAQPAPAEGHGARIAANVACANPGDTVTVAGTGLEANAEVKVQWRLPNGNALFSTLANTDARGAFSARVQVRPASVTQAGVPGKLEAMTTIPVGGVIASQSLKDVINNIVVTIFMALLATTAGTLIAAPVSFLAARNIMGRRRAGRVTYAVVRAVLNVTR